MLRHIASSTTRSPLGVKNLYRPVSQVTLRHYSSGPDAQKPKVTPPVVSNPPTPPVVSNPPTPPVETKKTENYERQGGSSGAKILGIGFLLAAIAAGAAHYYPDSRAKLEEWGVYSTIDSVRAKLGIAPFQTSPKSEPAVPEVVVPVPAVHIALENEPLAVQEAHHKADAPVEIVPLKDSQPLTPQELVPVEVEGTEIIPIEIIEIAQPDIAIVVEPPKPEIPESSQSPETVISELINELTAPVTPAVDFQALITAQAEQLEALREKLQQYYQDSNRAIDDRSKAQENALHEALALRERVYRRELEEKLTQLQAQLQAQFESQRQADRNEAQAHFLQQTEARKAELQREMEEALKAATDKAEAHYSVLLAEEINKFDSKLAAELSAEDVKYNTAASDRLKAIEKLNGEVSLLETVLLINAARLKENIHLHNVSSALFDLGITTLASPVRVSFVSELEKLEAASKALGEGTAVVSTVAEVLRPIAAVGVAPYTELTERFKKVVTQGRQAALVPEGGGMMDNLVAAVAAKLIIPAKGPVAGDSPEAIFAKAEYYLEHGDLQDAVSQLSLLRGMPASIVRDWLQAASDRLTVENSLKALHAHVIVLAHQQSSKEKI